MLCVRVSIPWLCSRILSEMARGEVDGAPATYTGTGTMFGAYPCSAPTRFKYKMNIYWPIKKNKLTNKEIQYTLHSNVNLDHISKENMMLLFNVDDRLR